MRLFRDHGRQEASLTLGNRVVLAEIEQQGSRWDASTFEWLAGAPNSMARLYQREVNAAASVFPIPNLTIYPSSLYLIRA